MFRLLHYCQPVLLLNAGFCSFLFLVRPSFVSGNLLPFEKPAFHLKFACCKINDIALKIGSSRFIFILLTNFETVRKQLFYLLAAVLFISTVSNAQSLRQPVSAVYLGLGAYSIQHNDIF